jgi:site-specific DNA-methyltransferase (adenine-specific)
MINLFNEDCLETLKRLEDNTIDLCLTDLPYGILSSKKEADYQNENRNFCDWDFEINYDEVLPQLKRVMKKDGNILLFAKSPFTFRLYDQMIKHGFTFRYNWIWKKQQCANFASMKYRPGNNYEEVMVFSTTPKRGKYFPHAEFNGETKTKCKFYNYKTRTPLSSEEVFDKYLIPYILGNVFNEDVRIGLAPAGARSNTGAAGKQLKEILNEDIGLCSHIHGGETHSDNMNIPKIKLDQLFKEKYQGQFEIDLENKILYRTVKSYRNFPTSIIDIKYRNEAGKKYKKHPTTKPVEVLEYLLDHYTEENDLVLDMTSGSGSTAVACKNMNRNFVGSEISQVWYDVALQRLDIK